MGTQILQLKLETGNWPRLFMTLRGHPHEVVERAHQIGHAVLRDFGPWRFEDLRLMQYDGDVDSDARFEIVLAVKGR